VPWFNARQPFATNGPRGLWPRGPF
jgi:hypothetical protein